MLRAKLYAGKGEQVEVVMVIGNEGKKCVTTMFQSPALVLMMICLFVKSQSSGNMDGWTGEGRDYKEGRRWMDGWTA